MNIILGATGHVGNAVVEHLVSKKAAVRGIIRDPEKAHALAEKGAQVGIADGFDADSLVTAFKDGSTAFLITPESFSSNDVFGDARTLLENYKTAVEKNAIKKIIGLSSKGAELDGETGNLKISQMLEQTFEGVNIQQIFIRPAYYFSNWLMYLDAVKETGILSTYYPVDLKIAMCSPDDVGEFAATLMTDDKQSENKVYELRGPAELSSADIAAAFSKILNKPVEARQIPDTKWGETMENMGFSIDATEKFIAMTKTLIEDDSQQVSNNVELVNLKTSFEEYLAEKLN